MATLCSTDGCGRKAKVKGMCKQCYARQYAAKRRAKAAAEAMALRRPRDFVFRDRNGESISPGHVVRVMGRGYPPPDWEWSVQYTDQWLLRHIRSAPGKLVMPLTEELASSCEVVTAA